MADKRSKEDKLGSFICLLLRHKGKQFGLQFDKYGYCSVADLLSVVNKDSHWKLDDEGLRMMVASDSKERYRIKGDLIRARYGHSFPVEHEEEETARELPEYLYHGTNEQALKLILGKREGIKPMSRQDVHLSETFNFSTLAAERRKNPKMLKVDVKKAVELGVAFKFVGGEVWQSTAIPFACIEEIDYPSE